MVDWRAEALAKFPELAQTIEAVDSPMGLWSELSLAFEVAYEEEPVDREMIRRIYDFADWCLQQEQVDDARFDLPTCVITCFYEGIPRSPAARAEMHKWFSREELERGREVFGYFLNDEEWADLLKTFPNDQRSNSTRRRAERVEIKYRRK
jgi:hypothetical protein